VEKTAPSRTPPGRADVDAAAAARRRVAPVALPARASAVAQAVKTRVLAPWAALARA